MANLNVKVGGTRTIGASTTWFDFDCYSTMSAAFDQVADGDSITLNDEDHIITTNLNTLAWSNLTLSSRSGDPDNCRVILNNPDAYVGIVRGSVAGSFVTIQDITFTRGVTHTGSRALFLTDSGLIDNVTFSNVKMGDITVQRTGSGSGGVFYRNGSTHPRNVVFKNVEFGRVDGTYTNNGAIVISMRGSGARFTYDGCTFRDWTISHGGVSQALMWCDGLPAEVTYKDCLWQDIFSLNPGNACIKHLLGPTISRMYNCRVIRVTRGDSSFSGGAFFHFITPFDIDGVYSEDCVNVIRQFNSGGDGCLLYQSSTNAVGRIRNVIAHRSVGRSGGCIFCSNGGKLDCENIQSYDARIAHGAAIYVGFNNDADINGVICKGAQNGSATASNSQSNGMAIYLRHNPGAPARNSTMNVRNVTMIDNSNVNGLNEGLSIQNSHATASMTATVTNVISNNVNANEIDYQKLSGAGTLVVTETNVNVKNGAVLTVGGVNTTVNSTNRTTIDPQLNDDGSLPPGSPLSGAGTRWWPQGSAPPVDALGRPFPPVDIDIGGIQGDDPEGHPFAAVNL